MVRWRIAVLVFVAIAISYLDRQTLPVAVESIKKLSDFKISDQQFALLNTAFLGAYGAMYLGGGWLMDRLGTRRGFGLIMIFWSIACASHGVAMGLSMLVVSRLMLGIGEGGGFPAATRVVAEWFPVKERSLAMGLINAGTALGGIVAPLLIAWVISSVHWLDVTPWRWVFFLTGAMGLMWTVWWLVDYQPPEKHTGVTGKELAVIEEGRVVSAVKEKGVPLGVLLSYRETWGIVGAKFLSDAAWYFMLLWLPKYLQTEHKVTLAGMGLAAIPHAAAGVGCLVGGGLSSVLLARGVSLNRSRLMALGLSAGVMPLLMLVPFVSLPWVIVLFSVGYFGQQSWSSLVMVLPTDLFPKRAVGTVAGLVGLGGALGGIVFGQVAGWLLDHGYSYVPVLVIAGSLHVAAFGVILLLVRRIRAVMGDTISARSDEGYGGPRRIEEGIGADGRG